MRRLWYEEIDSVGTFDDNRVKMDIVFQDTSGNEYVWTPRWEEVLEIYSEGERVEELNEAGGEWLEDLKEQKQFSLEVLEEVAKVIAEDRSTNDLEDFFEAAGFSGERFDYNVGTDLDLKSKVERWDNRLYATRAKLEELNEQDYRFVVQAVQKAADPKQYIGDEERHEDVIEQLNQALKYENMRVTDDGRVLPAEHQ